MVYKRVRGRPRLVEDAPGEQVISNIKDTMLYITQILRISAGVRSSKYVIYLNSNNY